VLVSLNEENGGPEDGGAERDRPGFAEALADLEAREPSHMVPDLDRIRALTELLDHPERTYPAIHVTGTNGKTTTARIAGRILCGHGLATGVYTSPHLASVTERLALCDGPIAEAEFGEAYAHLRPYLETVDAGGERVTYFETLTALAYLWFADKPVDAGVFEVGMGGEWDATNLVRGEVAVLCPIALDHPELGDTVAEVAREKAGIVKEGATVVVREQPPEALAVVEERAGATGGTIRLEGRDFALEGRDPAVGGQRIVVRGLHGSYEDLALPLHGEHQARNAAAGIAAAEALLDRALHPESLRQAVAGVTGPGRLEVVSRHPLVVLDGAHNPSGAGALAAALPEALTWERLHLVVGVLSTKDVDGILRALAALEPGATYACANANPKSLPSADLRAACDRAGLAGTEHSSVAAGLEAAEGLAEEGDLLLVTGSLYTVADARPRYVGA
jgi:dihydrofolate synthase/folylpolyglutamate synthase